MPGPTDFFTAAQHWDPGPFWNWDHFMTLVHGVSDSTERGCGGTVIIGTTPCYQISFSHREFFVQASDVTVKKLS
ncbi:MAG TPA: hypothetical protein VMV07_13085 [Streptosporangiaceae bacterium]|nr:hypothetical protein [Streptosporangiaceae bacterium]